MKEVDYIIRTAKSSDRSRLANLIHFGSYIHQHLDWKSPLDWIENQPYLILENEGNISAALACPPELPEITWIRLFAVSSNCTIGHAWRTLWTETVHELRQLGKYQVAALSLQSWFNSILEESNFYHSDNVVVLLWENISAMPKPELTDINIRPMLPEDLDIVAKVDNSAFSLEWRNSPESLEIAYHQSAMATVAELGNEIVGYQYSTSSISGGHLARLAVAPSMQSRGIGYSLVHNCLTQFTRLGVMHVTVNTQQKNTTSLGLYKKAGFKLTGESYGVYQYNY